MRSNHLALAVHKGKFSLKAGLDVQTRLFVFCLFVFSLGSKTQKTQIFISSHCSEQKSRKRFFTDASYSDLGQWL